MASKNEATYILDSKKGLPNKLLQADGTITDMFGNTVVNGDSAWEAKQALPNKFLNPDGTYSTLNEILAGVVDTGIYLIVDELPTEGDQQKIYLLSDEKGGFVEYHWTGDKWDPIGMVEFDISNYSTTQEMMNAIEAAGLLTLKSAKSYADEKANTAEQNAKDYTDDEIANLDLSGVVTQCNEYADTKKSEAITSSNEYTDTAIQQSITQVLGGEY